MHTVRLVDRGEHDEAADAMTAHWGRTVARLGELVDTAALPRLVAERDGEIAGVLSFDVRDGMEVGTLDAARGQAMIAFGWAVAEELAAGSYLAAC